MEESLTQGAPADESVVTDPTLNESAEASTAETNQETNSGEQTNTSQETVTTDETANTQTTEEKQTEQTSGQQVETDDGVAKFAKSQGIDWATATENEKRLAKIAHDNQRAARQNMSQAKLTDATQKLNQNPDGSVTDSLRLTQLESKIARDEFFRQDGIDASVEPAMVDVLTKTREESGDDVARSLSKNLPLLYKIAQVENGTQSIDAAKQLGRQEERASIKTKAIASAPAAHAVTQSNSTPKVTRDWIAANPNYSDNPEQRAMVEEALARGDLY